MYRHCRTSPCAQRLGRSQESLSSSTSQQTKRWPASKPHHSITATDSESEVKEWLLNHPEGDILVTNELAEKMGLESTGISNDDLTVNVDEVTDKLIDDPDIIDYIPFLTVASIARIIVCLWQRYRNNEITREQFISLATRSSGLSAAKVLAIIVLLKIPIINVITGAYLVARVIIATHSVYS